MRVELQISEGCDDPYAVLHIAGLTPEIQTAVKLLKGEGMGNILAGQANGKVYILEPETVEVIRTEGRELVIYNANKERFTVNKPLYELEELLGSRFIRISKSAIVQIGGIHHVEASFNGTMEVVLKNGVKEVITRSYRQLFKERLGV